MRIEIAERRRRAKPGLARRVITRRALNVHAAVKPFLFRPVIAPRQGNLEFVSRFGRTMAEPVMDLELDPGSRKEVEFRGGNEFVPRQQLARYHAGTWLEQCLVSLGYCFSQGNVAPEARPRHSHARMCKTVVRTVGRSPALVAGFPFAGGFDAVTGMVKIVSAQSVSKGGKIKCSHERWQLIPPHEEIDDAIDRVQNPLGPCRMKFEAVVFARHVPPGGNPFFSNRTAHSIVLRSA